MKKFFTVLLLLPISLLAEPSFDFSEFNTNSAVNVLIEYYDDTGNIVSYTRDAAFDSVHLLYFNVPFRMNLFNSSFLPTVDGFPSRNTSQNYNQFPYKVKALDGSTVYLNYTYFPKVVSIFTFVHTLFRNGYRYGMTNITSNIYNINLPAIVYDLISGTNTLFRSSLVGLLNDVNSSSSASRSLLESIDYSLVRFSENFEDANGVYFSNFTNVIDSFVSFGYLDSSQGEIYKNGYAALSGSDRVNYADMIRRTLLNTQASQNNINNMLASSDNAEMLKEIGNQLNQGLRDDVNSGFSGSAKVQGAITNQLQRITNDVAQTKAQLQAWHDDSTNRLDRQWDGIKKIDTNTGDTAAYAKQIANNGVKIVGPVEVHTDTDFKANVTIADANLSTINNSIASGANQAMQRWLDEWESFKASQVGYTALFPGFMESNTNILSSIDTKLDFGFTNVYDVIISALTNLTIDASITNLEFMLLSDYANYINSGGLTGLLDVMDDDEYSLLKDKLFSIGATDTDESYGRWWRYFTGLSTVQANSVLQINELFQANKKLVNDLVDNNDVSSISDPTVFSEILSSLPTLTKVEDTVIQLSNSLDRTGFDELSRLMPQLTNSFGFASQFFDRNFTLPTEVSWVLIPASEDLNTEARVITIHPYEHRKFFDSLHYGIAFAYCIVNIILLPKFLLFLVKLFDRIWVKYEGLIQASVQS